MDSLDSPLPQNALDRSTNSTTQEYIFFDGPKIEVSTKINPDTPHSDGELTTARKAYS